MILDFNLLRTYNVKVMLESTRGYMVIHKKQSIH